MGIRGLLRGAGIVGLASLLYVVYLAATMWRSVPVPGYEVRRNRFTGIAQVRDGDRWAHFRPDPYGQNLTTEDFRRLRITGAAWGPKGILAARATNVSAEPVTGRLAFRIVLRDARDGKFQRDRSLRESVDFPPNKTVPFVLRTDMTTPDPERTRTEITLQPTATSGD